MLAPLRPTQTEDRSALLRLAAAQPDGSTFLSHLVCMMRGMRLTSLFRRSLDRVPACCTDEVDHCHGTLVLHADGTVECEHEAACAADEAQHELWVTCDELRCGCVGDDAPLDAWLLAA